MFTKEEEGPHFVCVGIKWPPHDAFEDSSDSIKYVIFRGKFYISVFIV
jgi:hypothetical protein